MLGHAQDKNNKAHKHLRAKAVKMTSIDHEPRSTRSPFMSKIWSFDGSPVNVNRCRTSKNCPEKSVSTTPIQQHDKEYRAHRQ